MDPSARAPAAAHAPAVLRRWRAGASARPRWRRCLSEDLRAARRSGAGLLGPAALRAEGQARDLPVSVRRAVADGSVRLQAAVERSSRHRSARLDPHGPAADRHDARRRRPFRWRRRCSSSRSTGNPARGSASCCRTRRRSPTTCASSSRCTPRRSITIPASRSSRPASSWRAGRASGRGCPTASAARTRICRRSS